MTRPAGKTAHGFPYPGSAGIHPDTPRYMQDLANALQAQAGGTQKYWRYTGNVTFDNSSGFITFPGMAVVVGALAFGGTERGWGNWYEFHNDLGNGKTQWYYTPFNSLLAPVTLNAGRHTVWLSAIAWGW